MCGRYKLEEHWQEYCANPFFDWNYPPWPIPNLFKGSEEVFPRDSMPYSQVDQDGTCETSLVAGSWHFYCTSPHPGEPRRPPK